MQKGYRLTVEDVADFLISHPDWSPCLRLVGQGATFAVNDWQVQMVGVVGPSGMVYTLADVGRALWQRK